MSSMKSQHCSCNDTSCKKHPTNHEKGCTPCIESNLREGEIPSCFFNAINDDISELKTFKFKDFAEFYKLHNPDHTSGDDIIPLDKEEAFKTDENDNKEK